MSNTPHSASGSPASGSDPLVGTQVGAISSDSPLRSMPNVFLSPHIAGVTAADEPPFVDLMVDEVLRVLAGHRPRFRLSPREGPGGPKAGTPDTKPHADVERRRHQGGS